MGKVTEVQKSVIVGIDRGLIREDELALGHVNEDYIVIRVMGNGDFLAKGANDRKVQWRTATHIKILRP